MEKRFETNDESGLGRLAARSFALAPRLSSSHSSVSQSTRMASSVLPRKETRRMRKCGSSQAGSVLTLMSSMDGVLAALAVDESTAFVMSVKGSRTGFSGIDLRRGGGAATDI